MNTKRAPAEAAGHPAAGRTPRRPGDKDAELTRQVQNVECLLSGGYTYESLSVLIGGGVRPETVAGWGGGHHLARARHRKRLALLAEELEGGAAAGPLTGEEVGTSVGGAAGGPPKRAVNLSLARPAIRRGKLAPEERALVDLLAAGEGLRPGEERADTLRRLIAETGLLKSDVAREIQVPEKVLYAYLRPANLFRMALPTLRRVMVLKRITRLGYFKALAESAAGRHAEVSRIRARAEREVTALEGELLVEVRAADPDPVRACLLGALERRNLSQRAAAVKAGVSHPTMNGIIQNGERRVNESTVRKLISGLTLDDREAESLREAIKNRAALMRAAAPVPVAA